MAIGAPWLDLKRRVIRSTPNPMDKATVVSIFPRAIDETKVTLQPGNFKLAPGSYDHPSILVVGSSSWWREIDEDQPLLEIPVGSVLIADSIVKDYANGLLGCNMADKMPGLFFIPGAVTVAEIIAKHKQELDIALGKQRNWYKELVKIADVLWARAQGNPLVIDDLMKLAAQDLQLKDKPWLKDFNTLQLINCVSCGALRNPNFPVCQSCHTIVDPAKYKELKLEKAV